MATQPEKLLAVPGGDSRAAPVPSAAYDLHLHTCWSYDAVIEPARYFEAARERGMRAIAVTDHHVLDGLTELAALARRYPDVRFLRAAELTVTTALGSVDLVCLGFPDPLPGVLQPVQDRYHAWQCEHGAATCRGMQKLGFDFTEGHWHSLLASYRPARVTLVQGHTRVKNEFLRDYFIKRGFIREAGQYEPLLARLGAVEPSPPYPAASAVVPAVKAAGALVLIAHPTGYFGGAEAARMDALRAECALDGIECAHRSVPPALTPVYRAYCVRHGMVSTAGSDTHDQADLANFFGRHGGAEEWLDELLARIGR